MSWPIGYDRSAELLIEKGADVNVVGNDGKTALMQAATSSKRKSFSLCSYFLLNLIPKIFLF